MINKPNKLVRLNLIKLNQNFKFSFLDLVLGIGQIAVLGGAWAYWKAWASIC